MKTAIISGVTGQDGSYLAELLLLKGYRVVGLKRRTSLINTARIDHLYGNNNFILEYYDLDDSCTPSRLLTEYTASAEDTECEIYHLAAQSHVYVSFLVPDGTASGIVGSTLAWLDAIRSVAPATKFYHASSSEMFGNSPDRPYSEDSRMCPVSPYASAKLCAHNLVQTYRKAYKLFACNGILHNHESPRRGETFVTRKITMAAANIKLGKQRGLELGNLNAYRDWGFAGDYVEAMWLMLQQPEPSDFVIATGETHSVQEFLEEVWSLAGLGDWHQHVSIDERLLRPAEVDRLVGNPAKANRILGWLPKVSFKELAKMMYEADLQEASK